MKNIIKYIIYLSLFSFLPAQISFVAKAGLDLRHNKSLNDFKNYYHAKYGKETKTFDLTLQYGGEILIPVGSEYMLGIDFQSVNSFYSVKEFSYSNYELNYTLLSPSLILYYSLYEKGFSLKAGAGLGYRRLIVEEQNLFEYNYYSDGMGIVLRLMASSPIDKHFDVYLSGEIKADFVGVPDNNGKKLRNNIKNEDVNFNSFSGAFNLGIIYKF